MSAEVFLKRSLDFLGFRPRAASASAEAGAIELQEKKAMSYESSSFNAVVGTDSRKKINDQKTLTSFDVRAGYRGRSSESFVKKTSISMGERFEAFLAGLIAGLFLGFPIAGIPYILMALRWFTEDENPSSGLKFIAHVLAAMQIVLNLAVFLTGIMFYISPTWASAAITFGLYGIAALVPAILLCMYPPNRWS